MSGNALELFMFVRFFGFGVLFNVLTLEGMYLCQGKKKEYTPPLWHPSFLGLSPDPEVTEQKKSRCIPFSGKTREKGIHHRSGKKKPQTPKKKKRRVSTVVVYTFFLPCMFSALISEKKPFRIFSSSLPSKTTFRKAPDTFNSWWPLLA